MQVLKFTEMYTKEKKSILLYDNLKKYFAPEGDVSLYFFSLIGSYLEYY